MIRTRVIAVLVGLSFLFATLHVQVDSTGRFSFFFKRLDQLVYDFELSILQLKPKSVSPVPIVIVDIDEASIKRIGRWPWPRKIMAELTQKIFDSGAILIGFDILFSGEDENPAKKVLEKLNQKNELAAKKASKIVESLISEFKSDDAFSQAIKDKDVVMGFYLNQEPGSSAGALPTNVIEYNPEKLDELLVMEMKNYIGSLQKIQDAGRLGGFTTSMPDEDGIVRRVPLVLEYKNKLYGSFPLEMVKAYLLLDKVELVTQKIGETTVIDKVILGDIHIPTDEWGRMLIPYLGGSKSFEYVPASKILFGEVDPTVFDNSLVLIGTSASSLGDLHNTPLENAVYPGVEIQATILHAILSKHFLWHPNWHDGLMITLLFVIGVVCSFLFPYLRAMHLICVSILLFISILGFQIYILFYKNLVVSCVKPLFLLVVLAIFNIAYGFIFESRKRVQLKKFFEQYVPEAHIEKMTAQEKTDWLAGESRMMSVLFCDICHFTDLSEKLSAKEVKQYLNHVLTPITKIIFDNQGTIDKYMGDLVMAFWGAPLADTDYVVHGLKAVLSIQKQAIVISEKLKELGFPPVRFTVGYHEGEMYVGDMGSEYRRAYTVLGDTVNLSSRLQMLCSEYHVDQIVSEVIKEKCPEFAFHIIDRVCVKGKKDAVTIYEPIGVLSEISQASQERINKMEAAYTHYTHQEWDMARALFGELQKTYPDIALYSIYLERISMHEKHPLPKDWDGVTILTHK